MGYGSIVEEVARRHGVPAAEARREMEYALGDAFRRRNPKNEEIWKVFAPDGVQPELEDFLFVAVTKLIQISYAR